MRGKKSSPAAFARRMRLALRNFIFAVAALGIVSSGLTAEAQTYTVLHSFNGTTDGYYTYGTLVIDPVGNLYGIASHGGDMTCGNQGCGVVFKIDPSGNETVLHVFESNGTDGVTPQGGLIRDSSGNLYGTTSFGGTTNSGTIFKLDSSNTETTLYNFMGTSDGNLPFALTLDSAGNIYGLAAYGGHTACRCGTLFELSATGVFKTLHTFWGVPDGSFPDGVPMLDGAGYIYGSTGTGGKYGKGAIFRYSISGGQYSVISLKGAPGADGAGPISESPAGDFYILTGGGTNTVGMAIKVHPWGTRLGAFNFGTTSGAYPIGPLIFDSVGNGYGTTEDGGTSLNYGVIFKFDSNLNETVLYTLTDGSNGENFNSGLVADPAGNLYGTALWGGASQSGVVFKFTP
jgi:uncharacterized repeat protein (TIGR03803 family)